MTGTGFGVGVGVFVAGEAAVAAESEPVADGTAAFEVCTRRQQQGSPRKQRARPFPEGEAIPRPSTFQVVPLAQISSTWRRPRKDVARPASCGRGRGASAHGLKGKANAIEVYTLS
jgi:hypothetical protein